MGQVRHTLFVTLLFGLIVWPSMGLGGIVNAQAIGVRPRGDGA
jgi:hypothetical protein